MYVSISSQHDHYHMMIGKIICLTLLAPLVNTSDAYLQLIHLYFLIENYNIYDYFRVPTSVLTTKKSRYRPNDHQVESEVNLLSDSNREQYLGYRV
jgi:hypothetical protein